VATSAPNFVRATTVPVTLAFSALAPLLGGTGTLLAMGAGVFGLAFLAMAFLEETYGKDLDYNEPMTAAEARRLLQERRARGRRSPADHRHASGLPPGGPVIFL